MLLFHHKIFSTMLSGTDTRYSSPDLYRELSRAQQFAVSLRMSEFADDGVSILYGLESSVDGSLFTAQAGGTLGTSQKDVVAFSESKIDNAPPLGPFVRFSLQLSGVSGGMCEVWVTGRARDFKGGSMVSMLGAYRGDEPAMGMHQTEPDGPGGVLDEEAVEWLATTRSPYDWSKDGMALTAGSGITPHAERGWRPRTELGSAGAGTSTGTAPAAAFRGPMGAPGTGGSTLDDRLADVGRLLDITRDLDALRELRDRTMFEVIDSITEGGLSAELANSPLAQRLGYGQSGPLGTIDVPASTTGRRQRVGYDDSIGLGEEGSGSISLGRWDLLADNAPAGGGNFGMPSPPREPGPGASDEDWVQYLAESGKWWEQMGDRMRDHARFGNDNAAPGSSGGSPSSGTPPFRPDTPPSQPVPPDPPPSGGTPGGLEPAPAPGPMPVPPLEPDGPRGPVPVEKHPKDPLVEGGPIDPLTRFLVGRIGSPGVSWSPSPSQGGGPRKRPPPDAYGSSGTAATGPRFVLHRGALVGVEPRRTFPRGLHRESGAAWIMERGRPPKPDGT